MPNTAEIERIVREVLAEMAVSAGCGEGAAPAAPMATPASTATPTVRQEPRPPDTPTPCGNHELVLAARLVTMNEVDGHLAGVRRLVVRPGTVITPAVKEDLAKRSIQVTFSGAANDTSAGPLRLVIVAARAKIDPQPLAAALRSERIDVELHSSKCVIEATDRLAGEVAKPATLGLLLTPHEAESLCLANRHPGVRAIAGREPGQVAADAAAVGANLLVISPKTIGPYAIRQMLGEFCHGGIRPCPDIFKHRLT